MRRVFFASLLALTACPAPRAPAPDAAPPAPTATKTSTGPDNAALLAEIFVRLADEADHRPNDITLPVETVLERLRAAGFGFREGQQVLAAMVHAKYCWQSNAEDGSIGVSICEYDTVDALKKGETESRIKGAGFGERTFVANGKTLLTVAIVKPGSEPTVEKVKAAFLAMR